MRKVKRTFLLLNADKNRKTRWVNKHCSAATTGCDESQKDAPKWKLPYLKLPAPTVGRDQGVLVIIDSVVKEILS